jgi:transposase
VHLLASGDGKPIRFRITGGERSDYAEALPLLVGCQAEAVIADKGYDSDTIVNQIAGMGAECVIPSRRHRRQQRNINRDLYKRRNLIERCFNRLKQFRRLATRYCKLKAAFAATVALACSWIHLLEYVNTA